ncbi:hypothetical protein J2T13_000858 [Paenibacillus sp. DS2015]|uniref:hypothetical protein n=1 Tax=Paenibacillus sp. DS2015 TaxID=3373917 RepID=UPI003D1A6232
MKPLEDEPTYIQPEKCKRCVWGEWTGTKQWCSKKDCAKDGEVNGNQTTTRGLARTDK